MKVCYVVDDVPANRLEIVKQNVVRDNCEPLVWKGENGLYKVIATCEGDEEE